MSMASIEALEARRKLSVNLFDPTFGKGGAVALGNGPAAAVSSDAVQLQADGKIVVNTPSGVRRFNGEGRVDGSFGVGGVIDTGLAQPDVGVEPDGRIVATVVVDDQIIVERWNVDGSHDGTFGSAGMVTLHSHDPVAVTNGSSGIAVAPDGKILIAASLLINEPPYFYGLTVFRLNLDGSLDNSYGDRGEAEKSGTTFQYNGADVLALPDGSAVESSQYYAGISSGTEHRLLSPSGADVTYAPHDPKTPTILVRTDTLFSDRASIGRFLGSAADAPFGADGDGNAEIQLLRAITIPLVQFPDGRIVAAGLYNDKFAFYRMTADGLPDRNFGADGTLLPDMRPLGDAGITQMLATPGGDVLALAYATTSDPNVSSAFLYKLRMRDAPEVNVPAVDPPLAAKLIDVPVVRRRAKRVFITVRYTDDFAIKALTARSSELQLVGPGSENIYGAIVAPRVQWADSPSISVTYEFKRIDGHRWDETNNGYFSVVLPERQVSNRAGDFIPSTTLGTLRVHIRRTSRVSVKGARTRLEVAALR